MSSRDAILARIKTGLARQRAAGGLPGVGDVPPVPEVWPRTNPSADELANRFTEELEALGGEVYRIRSMEDARAKFAELAAEAKWKSIGSVDRPLCHELDSDLFTSLGEEVTPKEMSELEAGLLEADYLLADTGTCMIACATPQQRLMCYLPPVSVVIAKTDQLVEHMPAVWSDIARRCAEPDLRGEFVFISGPSRTADIEKILILGVHGPKRLIVLLVD